MPAPKTTAPEQLVRAEKVAEILDVELKTLRMWRYRQVGPPYLKVNGGAVRYRLSDLHAWLDSQPAGGEPPSKTRRTA